MRFLILIGLLLVGNISAADYMMVWKKSASLYNEQGRNMMNIPQGEIVEAIIHPKDNSLLMVKYQGKKYNSPGSSYKSLDDMAAYHKKRLIDLEGSINEHNMKISANSSQMDLMFIKALELRRDTAVAYKKVSYINGTSHIGYKSSLNEGNFRKLMKEWEEGYTKLSDEFKKSHLVKRQVLQEIEKSKHILANLDSKLKAFSEGKRPDHKTLFATKKEGARLYKENKIVKYLKHGESALGKKDSKHPGWYKILVDKKVYLVSGEDVSEKDKYLSSLKAKQSTAVYEISYLTEQVEKLQFRLKLVNGVSRQLEADKFVAGGYGVVKNYVIPIDKDRSFTLESPDATKLYINSARAERVLREWKKEALELSAESLKMQKRVIFLKKALIDYEKALKAIEN